MVTCFWPKHSKCLKMGSNCQIFASLRTRITIFSDLKRITMVKEIPRKGVSAFKVIRGHQLYKRKEHAISS